MIIVQKFGGSSLATTEHIKKVADFIVASKKRNVKIVVVASAMGKTTNNLLQMANELSLCPNRRELDRLLSTGELQTVPLLAIRLNELGVQAVSLSGKDAGILTNDNYGKAFIKSINPFNVQKYLNSGKIVVVAGFQGGNKSGEITTLGRGGSDTTAVALASVLNAKCEIYTDVDCLYSIDPKTCKNSTKIKRINYQYVLEMAFNGAKALETRAVEIGCKYNVDLFVGKSLEFDKSKGTKIMNNIKSLESVRIINISVKENIYNVCIKNVKNDIDIALKVAEVFKERGLPLEMATQIIDGESSLITLCLNETSFEQIKEQLTKLQLDYQFTIYAKLTLVGVGIASHSEILQMLLKTMRVNNLPIFQFYVTENTLSVLINKTDVTKSVDVLAKTFNL